MPNQRVNGMKAKASRPFKILFLAFIWGVNNSCSSLKSGDYIYLAADTEAAVLGRKYKVPEWKIEEANREKNFKRGEWVFVPHLRPHIGHRPAHSYSFSSKERSAHSQEFDLLWPVPSSNRISSHFGKRWGKMHTGVDIPARHGAHIVAAEDGTVVYSGAKLGAYGNTTIIFHGQGRYTVYAHSKTLYTVKGQRVSRGEVIATVGSTGKSTAPHLHFELRERGNALDPRTYLAKR